MPKITLTFTLGPALHHVWCQSCQSASAKVVGVADLDQGKVKFYLCDNCAQKIIDKQKG